ncbi:hypothetical protein M407DRAFT_7970 [Tulasnella calospora MUT 4182]|uniref:Helicase C-terminal domain-containing protein n=1 Tax=Tulasnella calospora MUT 4182 TaxID=1051891 RepID=A0A0C3QJ83_9AGAM|nr:hypothetical protein M407DRAFT_7970 [Tulasnella calospora MUT 4182]
MRPKIEAKNQVTIRLQGLIKTERTWKGGNKDASTRDAIKYGSSFINIKIKMGGDIKAMNARWRREPQEGDQRIEGIPVAREQVIQYEGEGQVELPYSQGKSVDKRLIGSKSKRSVQLKRDQALAGGMEMPRVTIGVASQGFARSIFSYPEIAKIEPPASTYSPADHIVQVQISRQTEENSGGIQDALSNFWSPWVVAYDLPEGQVHERASQLCTFLNIHQYFRLCGSADAGKEISSVQKTQESMDITYNNIIPPVGTKLTIAGGLTKSWRKRTGEDVTDRYPQYVGTSAYFNSATILVADWSSGRDIWDKYFREYYWKTNIGPRVTQLIQSSNDQITQIKDFASSILGSPEEPRNRPSYESSCKVLMAAALETLKKRELRGSKSKTETSLPSSSMVSTPQATPHNDTRLSTQTEQVSPLLTDSVRQFPKLPEYPRSVGIGLSSEASLGSHPGPSSCPPPYWAQMDEEPAIPKELQNTIHGEIGTEPFKRMTDSELDALLVPEGYDGIPGMKPGTQLRWHQKVFLIFALTRLFENKPNKRWGGLALFDSPGLGKTASILALQAILGAEIEFQHRRANDQIRLTPLMDALPITEGRRWFQGMAEIPSRPSFVIALDGTVRQWEAETNRFLENGLSKVYIYSKETEQGILQDILQERPFSQGGSPLIIVAKSRLIALFQQLFDQKLGVQSDGFFRPTSKSNEGIFGVKPLAVYVDEMHNCRNQGILHYAVHQLCKDASVRVGLTATPIPTRLDNLLLQARAIHMDGFAGSDGNQRISDAVRTMSTIQRSARAGTSSMSILYEKTSWVRVEELLNQIKPWIFASTLRRTTDSIDPKGGCLVPLPRLSVTRVDIILAPHERQAVEATKGWCRSVQICSEKNACRFNGFQTAIRRALIHVSISTMVGRTQTSSIGPEQLRAYPSSKLRWMIQKIQFIFQQDKDAGCSENARRKIIVCTEWSGSMSLIELAMNLDNITASFIDGSMSGDARAKVISELNRPGPHPDRTGHPSYVCVMSRSNAVGNDCPRPSVMILLDAFWSFADYEQAIARCWRMGQTREVEAFVLIAKETVEEEMYTLSMSKKKVMNGLVGGRPGLDAICLIGKPTHDLEDDELTDPDDTPTTPVLAQNLLTDEEYPLSVLQTTLSNLGSSPGDRYTAPLEPHSSPTPFDQGLSTSSVTFGKPTPVTWPDFISNDQSQHKILSPSQEIHPETSKAPIVALTQRLLPNGLFCANAGPSGEERTPPATSADASGPGVSQEPLSPSQQCGYLQQRIAEQASYSSFGSGALDQEPDSQHLDGSGSCGTDWNDEAFGWDGAASSWGGEGMPEPFHSDIRPINEQLPHDRSGIFASIFCPLDRCSDSRLEDGSSDCGMDWNMETLDRNTAASSQGGEGALEPFHSSILSINKQLPHDGGGIAASVSHSQATGPDYEEEEPIDSTSDLDRESGMSDQDSVKMGKEQPTRPCPQRWLLSHISVESLPEHIKAMYVLFPSQTQPQVGNSSQSQLGEECEEWVSDDEQRRLSRSPLVRSYPRETGNEDDSSDEWMSQPNYMIRSLQETLEELSQDESLSSCSSSSLPEIFLPLQGYQDITQEDDPRDQVLLPEESEASSTDSNFDPDSITDENSESDSSARPTRPHKSKGASGRVQKRRKGHHSHREWKAPSEELPGTDVEEAFPRRRDLQTTQNLESEPGPGARQRSEAPGMTAAGTRFWGHPPDTISEVPRDSSEDQVPPESPPSDPNPFEAVMNATWLGVTELGLTDAQSRHAEDEVRMRNVLRRATAARGSLRGPP